MERFSSTKAQAWYIDFIIAIFIFALTVTVYFQYVSNLNSDNNRQLSEMLIDAKSISNSLMSSGQPLDWNKANVARIGIAENSRLNLTKLESFGKLNYTRAKFLFGSGLDFFIYFEDKNGSVLSFNFSDDDDDDDDGDNDNEAGKVGMLINQATWALMQKNLSFENRHGKWGNHSIDAFGTLAQTKNQVQIERLLIYTIPENSEIIRMVVALWN